MGFVVIVVNAGAPVQEARLLHGAPALKIDRWVSANAAGLLSSLGADAAAVTGRYGGARRRRCQVWDIFGHWMPGSDVGDADIRRLAGFAEGVVARVEVFAFLTQAEFSVRFHLLCYDPVYLQLVLQQIFLRWHFAIHTQQTLFVWAEGLSGTNISFPAFEKPWHIIDSR